MELGNKEAPSKVEQGQPSQAHTSVHTRTWARAPLLAQSAAAGGLEVFGTGPPAPGSAS